jgi:DDE superfamily endonuclease
MAPPTVYLPRRASALAKVKVIDSRAAVDFAACMRELTDIHFPEAERVRVVMDNLSTHSAGALYQAFPACEARRVLQRLEFHYVPKHASWLNMVEIEIGVLRGQCLDRRIDNRERLVSEIAAWERQRNASGAPSNRCSQPKKPAPRWAAPIPIQPRPPATLNSKSHNHCAEVLVAGLAVDHSKEVGRTVGPRSTLVPTLIRHNILSCLRQLLEQQSWMKTPPSGRHSCGSCKHRRTRWTHSGRRASFSLR